MPRRSALRVPPAVVRGDSEPVHFYLPPARYAVTRQRVEQKRQLARSGVKVVPQCSHLVVASERRSFSRNPELASSAGKKGGHASHGGTKEEAYGVIATGSAVPVTLTGGLRRNCLRLPISVTCQGPAEKRPAPAEPAGRDYRV